MSTITIINGEQNPNEEYQINVRHVSLVSQDGTGSARNVISFEPSYRTRPPQMSNTSATDDSDGYGWKRIYHEFIPLLSDSNLLLKAPRFENREVTLNMLYKNSEGSSQDLFTESFVKEVSNTVDKYLESESSLLDMQRDIINRQKDIRKNLNSIGKGKVSTANPRILQKLNKIREERREQLASDASALEEEEKSFYRARYGLEMYYQSYFSICHDYLEQLRSLQSKSVKSCLDNSAGEPDQQATEEDRKLKERWIEYKMIECNWRDLKARLSLGDSEMRMVENSIFKTDQRIQQASQRIIHLENELQKAGMEEINKGNAFQDDFDERYGTGEDVPVYAYEWSSLWDRHRNNHKNIDRPDTDITEVYPVNISRLDEGRAESEFEEDPKVTEQIFKSRRYRTSGGNTFYSGYIMNPGVADTYRTTFP
ncbi:hypothetical protein L486_07843 [Kwoniella mangroviensis CBS 10435]|uniref:Uncharacterized protein n=1 Tax=Kwoniella mangroviensis CBS 10435 TaxID=1331196 RepID=A0A1B9IGB7_9TREE|nr:uncharacterized protein I203_07151 [Kwoniella mangroviensis CBS 8507]OCF54709.1 hypothetical protein L486_07843 [Kwoniella mangroviensis CBS 10435]OCF63830.1 hypothetical protein I203_07151 [Kwoniella mangroviensis CBS 8507]OCF78659.1 hypothetical protein I204_00601 [Kwoniella mangroviensis CBS 8886]